jgi:hypothetical protein
MRINQLNQYRQDNYVQDIEMTIPEALELIESLASSIRATMKSGISHGGYKNARLVESNGVELPTNIGFFVTPTKADGA